MQIDRSNYEIWLIDWLDGNLSDYQVKQLKFFLSENPELKEEFDELNRVSLKPFVKSYSNKNHLKKSNDELSVSQFEYLCVAYLQNDLTPGQQTELKEIIDQDREKMRTFDLIQKTRLTPSDISYKHKNQLVKRTAVQKVIRLSVIGLSTAAIVTLIIMTYLIIPRNLNDKSINSAQEIAIDTLRHQPSYGTASDGLISDSKPGPASQKTESQYTGVQNNKSVLTQSEPTEIIPVTSSLRNTENPELQLKRIPVNVVIILKKDIVPNMLVASNSYYIIPPSDDERSNISRYIAITFREKILKENTSTDSPLKAYEFAEAGITGLNKLLGWEMALDKKNDENGVLRSVYFSSKILTFNAPVRKSEPLP